LGSVDANGILLDSGFHYREYIQRCPLLKHFK